MKIILTTFLFPLFAQATPAVGDFIVFEVGSVPVSETWTIERRITARDKDNFEITETTTKPNSISQKNYWRHQSEIITDDRIEGIFKNCGAMGGLIVHARLPIGVTKSCRISRRLHKKAETTFFAKVPFGVAAFSIQDGQEFRYLNAIKVGRGSL